MSVVMSESFVSVPESRVQVERLSDGIRIVVPRSRPFWGAAAAIWTLVVVIFGLVLMTRGDGPGPSTAFLALWIGIGAVTFLFGVWGRFAAEELRLTTQALVHERRLGPIARRRAYDRSRVKHLQVSPEPYVPRDPRTTLRIAGVGGGTIAFDYGSRTVRVAQADEAEARKIVDALRHEGLDR
jgi:hypothetical protein